MKSDLGTDGEKRKSRHQFLLKHLMVTRTVTSTLAFLILKALLYFATKSAYQTFYNFIYRY